MVCAPDWMGIFCGYLYFYNYVFYLVFINTLKHIENRCGWDGFNLSMEWSSHLGWMFFGNGKTGMYFLSSKVGVLYQISFLGGGDPTTTIWKIVRGICACMWGSVWFSVYLCVSRFLVKCICWSGIEMVFCISIILFSLWGKFPGFPVSMCVS